MVTTVSNVEEIYIYESPDGGKTIYRRHSGSGHREMIQDSGVFADRWHNWREILREAETNPQLNELVERAEIYYGLSRN